MNKDIREQLVSAGWVVGTTEEFLDLSELEQQQINILLDWYEEPPIIELPPEAKVYRLSYKVKEEK